MRFALLLVIALVSLFSCTKKLDVNYTYLVEPGPNDISVKYNIRYSREESVDIKANEVWKKDVTLVAEEDEYYLYASTMNMDNKPGTCRIAVIRGVDTLRFSSFEVDQNTPIGWTTISGTARK